jgi:hypothetical protein
VVCSLKKGRVGRKAIAVNLEALRNIPLRDRMTIEDVCAKLNMSKWMIQKYLKKSLLRRHSSSIKPYLTETNKKARLQWCVDMIKRDFLVDPMFKCLFDIKSEKYYLGYSKKMIPIRLVRTRNTSLDLFSCVLLLGQGLGMGIVF